MDRVCATIPICTIVKTLLHVKKEYLINNITGTIKKFHNTNYKWQWAQKYAHEKISAAKDYKQDKVNYHLQRAS